MTLTTTVDGDEIEFCVNAIAPNSADDSSSTFGVQWTDGIELSPTNYNQDGVAFVTTLFSGSWLDAVYDSIVDGQEGS